MSDSIKNNLINFFKIQINQNSECGKLSRCVHLINALNANGSSEMQSWFKKHYPFTVDYVNFFLDNPNHFVYDNYTGVIAINEDYDKEAKDECEEEQTEEDNLDLGLILRNHCGERIDNVIGVVESVTKSKAVINIELSDEQGSEIRTYSVMAVEHLGCLVNDILPLDFRHHLKLGDKVKMNLQFYQKGVLNERTNQLCLWIVKLIVTSKRAVAPAAAGEPPSVVQVTAENHKKVNSNFVNKPVRKNHRLHCCNCDKMLKAMSNLPFDMYQKWALTHRELIVDVYIKRLMISDIFEGKSNYELMAQLSGRSGPILFKNLITSIYYAFK